MRSVLAKVPWHAENDSAGCFGFTIATLRNAFRHESIVNLTGLERARYA